MLNTIKNIKLYIATIGLVAMFFSCTNSTKQVRDLLADKNLPIGIAKDAYHVYKDSGKITSKLKTPLMHDFSNRKEHPYSEFPKGIEIISFQSNGTDSITIKGNYAITYNKTKVSELVGNVEVINHTNLSKLETEQLFWDQNEKYIFSDKKFRLTKVNDTVNGVGFESKENLTKWTARDISGAIETKEN